MQQKTAGFTFIEALIVIALIGILVAIGIPNLSPLIVRNTIASHSNHLMASLQYARSEAIKRGVNVAVCRADSAAADRCAAANSDWSLGWLVYVNDGSAGSIAPQNILRYADPVAAPYTIKALTGSGGIKQLIWGATGELLSAGIGIGAARFEISNLAGHYAAHSRAICISSGGRPRIVQATATGLSCS